MQIIHRQGDKNVTESVRNLTEQGLQKPKDAGLHGQVFRTAFQILESERFRQISQCRGRNSITISSRMEHHDC